MKKIIVFLSALSIVLMMVFVLETCKKSDSGGGSNCTTPDSPVPHGNSPVATGDTIKLSCSDVTGATYNWTGPLSFKATGQSIKIPATSTTLSGTYSVTATVKGCTSLAANLSIQVITLKTVSFNGITLYIYPTDYYDVTNKTYHFPWGNGKNSVTNATDENNGYLNTTSIVALLGMDVDYAANLCEGLNACGHNDWYLPAKNELDRMYNFKNSIGGFTNEPYWSSTEVDLLDAITIDFTDETPNPTLKNTACMIRCIRHN